MYKNCLTSGNRERLVVECRKNRVSTPISVETVRGLYIASRVNTVNINAVNNTDHVRGA